MISDYLKKIKEAIYGEEVRSSIHDAIEQCYKDATGHPDSVAATVKEIGEVSKRIDNLIATGTAQSQEVGKTIATTSQGSKTKINFSDSNVIYTSAFDTVKISDSLFARIDEDDGSPLQILKEGLYYLNASVEIKSEESTIPATAYMILLEMTDEQYNKIGSPIRRVIDFPPNPTFTIERQQISYLFKVEKTTNLRFVVSSIADTSDKLTFSIDDITLTALEWKGKQSADLSELHDLRIGADSTVYGTAGEAVRKQIGNLTEDLGDIESKFEIETEAFINKCSIIRSNTPNNVVGSQITGVKQFFDFGKNATLTKIKAIIKSDNNDVVVCEIASLDGKIISSKEQALGTEYSDVQFDFENLIVKKPISVSLYMKNDSLLSYANYGTPFENPNFVYMFPDGTTKIAFKFGHNPFSDAVASDNKKGIVLFFDYSVKEIKAVKESILENIDETLLISGKSADAKVVGDKIKALENINSNQHIIYVSLDGNDENGDGTEENPFATIFHANEIITDNSKENPYKIIVKNGTYRDLQEKYAGIDGTYYQGIICKPYVTYQSEDINRPDLCVLEWDGSVGYAKPVTDSNCVNKCSFHIPANSKGVYIKGFTFKSKNTRYCMHIETVGSVVACDWHFENCVFEWGGRPDEEDDGTVARACIGTGYSMLECGEFINCIFKCTNTNGANHMLFQTHDNNDTDFSSIKRGEHIRFVNCYFSVADGSSYAHFDLRCTKTSPIIKCLVEFINCCGLPIYVPSETYNKNFVCTEQYTFN